MLRMKEPLRFGGLFYQHLSKVFKVGPLIPKKLRLFKVDFLIKMHVNFMNHDKARLIKLEIV